MFFGGIIVGEIYRYFTYGWTGRYYVESIVNFTYYGFSKVNPCCGLRCAFTFCGRSGGCLCVVESFTALPRWSFLLHISCRQPSRQRKNVPL